MLFTCPSRYSFTIGHTRVFSLGGWSPQFHARLLESGVTQELHYDERLVSHTGLSPSLALLSRRLRLPALVASVGPTTPWRPKAPRFGLFPVRSPLLRESRLISLPPGTEMFQFPGFASRLREMTVLAHRRVSPFGNPRIDACVPLPLAYRSLPRPSSPSCAQASSTCFRSLDHNWQISQAEHARSTIVMTVFYAVKQVKRSVQLPTSNPSCDGPPSAGSIAISRVDSSYPTITTAIRCQIANTCSPSGNQRERSQTMQGGRLPRTFDESPEELTLTRHSGKEVIQPQVPLRLPCYDFAPVTTLAFGGLVPCGFRHRLRALVASMA